MTPPVLQPLRPPRPAVVTAAVWLQVGTVAVLLGLVWLVFRYAVDAQGDVDQAVLAVPDADPGEVSRARNSVLAGAALLALPLLVQAVWLAATAPSVYRGGNVARILVFVAGGLQLLPCLGLLGVGTLLNRLLAAPPPGGAAPPPGGTRPPGHAPASGSEFVQHLNAGNDDPFGDLVEGLVILGMPMVLLLTTVVVLLLALPPAHRYFVPRTGPQPLSPMVVVPGQLWPPPASSGG